MAPDVLVALQRANAVLASMLARLQAGRAVSSTITSQDLSELENQILLTGECLRNLPRHSPSTATITKETARYLNDLQSLKDFLPYLQRHLLAEKSRLEVARSHVVGASAWADANHETL